MSNRLQSQGAVRQNCVVIGSFEGRSCRASMAFSDRADEKPWLGNLTLLVAV